MLMQGMGMPGMFFMEEQPRRGQKNKGKSSSKSSKSSQPAGYSYGASAPKGRSASGMKPTKKRAEEEQWVTDSSEDESPSAASNSKKAASAWQSGGFSAGSPSPDDVGTGGSSSSKRRNRKKKKKKAGAESAPVDQEPGRSVAESTQVDAGVEEYEDMEKLIYAMMGGGGKGRAPGASAEAAVSSSSSGGGGKKAKRDAKDVSSKPAKKDTSRSSAAAVSQAGGRNVPDSDEYDELLEVGDVVVVQNKYVAIMFTLGRIINNLFSSRYIGTVQYVGPVHYGDGVFVGVELEKPGAGKNNGNSKTVCMIWVYFKLYFQVQLKASAISRALQTEGLWFGLLKFDLPQ